MKRNLDKSINQYTMRLAQEKCATMRRRDKITKDKIGATVSQ